MNTTRSLLTADAMPRRLAEVFRLLRTGRHICLEDGAVYRDLEVDEERYQIVFAALGYELVHHAQGFYYLKGGPTLTSKRLQAITFFLLVLFQDFDERKMQEGNRNWVQTLTSRVMHIDKLPHFGTTQLRGMMANLGVTPDTLQVQVLRPLKSLGMVDFRDDNRFQFRSPVYRFVDLVIQYADQDWEQPDAASKDILQQVNQAADAEVEMPEDTDNDDAEDEA